MRKSRVIIILAVAVVAVLDGMIWWAVATRPADPVYDGYPVSFYLNNLNFSGCYGGRMDSKALPRLLEALKRRDGCLRTGWIELWHHFPSWVTERAGDPIPAADVRLASCGLLGHNMGVEGRPAIPALIRALREDTDCRVQAEAADALGRIASRDYGPAVEALLAAMNNSDPEVRWDAAYALGIIADGKDKPVIETLVAATKDNDWRVVEFAGNSLCKLDPEAAAKAGVTNAFPSRMTTNSAGTGR